MARIALYKDNYADSTVVSNLFIDEYMKDANDAQLKVYFYLLRMLNAEQAISVSGIADKFNHTEKDVIRALKYWEKQQILDLDFDDNKTLVGIHLRDLSTQATPAPQHNVLLTSGPSQMQNTPAGVSVILPLLFRRFRLQLYRQHPRKLSTLTQNRLILWISYGNSRREKRPPSFFLLQKLILASL